MAAEKKRNIRKRKAREEESSEDEGEAGASFRARLEDTKLLQKLRARAPGVNAQDLICPPEDVSIAEIVPQSAPANDLLEAYVKEKAIDPAAEDPEMEKYIEQQLARRLGKPVGKSGSAAEPSEAARNTDEDDLYVIPAGLQGQQSKTQDVSSWMTGIVEVPLSLEHKLKNIEETEAAKRRMLRGGMSAVGYGEDDDEGAAPKEGSKVLPRIAYPRDFGKEKEKEISFRENALKEGPRKEWKKKQKDERS